MASEGKAALSGAASGAAAGSSLGPQGAAVGAGIGALLGFIGARENERNRKEAEAKQRRLDSARTRFAPLLTGFQGQANALLAANPTVQQAPGRFGNLLEDAGLGLKFARDNPSLFSGEDEKQTPPQTTAAEIRAARKRGISERTA